jgi:hypothetical protein
VVPNGPKSPNLCQTITSALILDYPPPTLVQAQSPSSTPSAKNKAFLAQVKGIASFLQNSTRVNGEDLVLVVHSDNTFFQLPPEVLVHRFHALLRESNAKLRRKYGVTLAEREGSKEIVQKYSQKVVFAASKHCSLNHTDDAACATVPQSTLPPDLFGLKTDKQRDGTRNRPRWLESGAAMGQAADLLPVYERLLEELMHPMQRGNPQMVLEQIFGKQEYLREIDRRRTTSWLSEMLWDMVGISEAANTTGVRVNLEPGKRYELGIGLDYESQLFFNMKKSASNAEFLRYRDFKKVSAVQMQHAVPREVRLSLPMDIELKAANPFKEPKDIEVKESSLSKEPKGKSGGSSANEKNAKFAFNATIDVMPPSWNFTWNDVPLMTWIHSAAVPAVIHVSGDSHTRSQWWSSMWYHPYARALLRRSMRMARRRSALEDPESDSRSKSGGVWTGSGLWIDYEKVCGGFEEKLFDDGLGHWGRETVDAARQPVYNLWGRLMVGKGPTMIDLGESKADEDEDPDEDEENAEEEDDE